MSLITRRPTQAPTNFSALRQDNAPRRLSIDPVAENITTVISADSEIEGTLSFRQGVKIDGVVKGDIKFGLNDGLCIVSKGGSVEGSIRGPRALIMGEVEGDVEVAGMLVLAPTAVIIGSVKCAKFIVYDGAAITGSIETRKPNDTVNHQDEQSTDNTVVVQIGRRA
ncbi:bactofilin family protein [Denitromonas halophila]|uniref:Polymer-forming cytoskeletal protein n=1 Tax=Denitromonas halophila TaxID=1629404 RepID=A0A557QSY5_9RHOO|nr:polymer-forming cytoskeletal protein [Denitromonas halophila]TVO55936.1 polymer-forming cytoskeletal protein [Denitromonas halophila]